MYPEYKLTIVGHSLGGAVAALAALEFRARGWEPYVTTFGEPRIGNAALAQYIDVKFNLSSNVTDRSGTNWTYRRVTHIGDPVPLLPLEEWGYRMHGGEIFISKSRLPPSVADMEYCDGDEDPKCILGPESVVKAVHAAVTGELREGAAEEDLGSKGWTLLARYRLWQLLFAHRDYFWRLGLCIPGGDPTGWHKKYPDRQ